MNLSHEWNLTFALVLLSAGQTLSVRAADTQAPDLWSGHISYVAGYKLLESEWKPAEGQVEFGIIDADFQPPRWPVSFCAQFLLSYSGDVPAIPDVQGDYSGVWEINLGVRKVWNRDATWQPFVGGGFSVLGASTSSWYSDSFGGFQDVRESAATVGAWVGGGLYWNFSDHWHAGVQVQYSWGELTLFNTDIDAGGFHALAMFGYHW